MKSYLGVYLLFFIQLFFLNLGINSSLSKKEKRAINDNILKSLLLKYSGFYIWKFENKKIYKLMMLLVYFLFIAENICLFFLGFYYIEPIEMILDISIKFSFFLIPLLIVLNCLVSKKS